MVCNNAGVAPAAATWGPLSTWEWVVGVNLWGVVHGVRAFLPHPGEGRRGPHREHGVDGRADRAGLDAVYDATKHAVVALTERPLPRDARAGAPVGVSVLCPG